MDKAAFVPVLDLFFRLTKPHRKAGLFTFMIYMQSTVIGVATPNPAVRYHFREFILCVCVCVCVCV
jgi:hypothetical protein